MNKVKEVCRNIIIFFALFGANILPTLMYQTKDDMNALFRQPEYWVISVFIALLITWGVIQIINNSKK